MKRSVWSGFVFATMMVLILISCQGIDAPFDRPNVTTQSTTDQYRLQYTSGDLQEYVGISPRLVQFSIYNSSKEEFLSTLYVGQVEVEMFARSMQGEFEYEDHPGINHALRVAHPSCKCFGMKWVIADEAIAGSLVDTVEIEISVVHKTTGNHVDGSPLIVKHIVKQ